MAGNRTLQARRITRHVPEAVLLDDLERYQLKALELGATSAQVVRATDVVVDERVRMKCLVPRCHLVGESPNCPPYTPEPDFMRKVLAKYAYALVFKHEVEPKLDFVDDQQWHQGHVAHQGKTGDIATSLEALAFNDGHYFAMAFGSGGCKTTLCKGQVCQFLDSGRCRFPLKARPSMEGVGIDVFDLACQAGWDIFPVAHRDVDPDSIGCAVSVGIVFVR